MAEGIQAKSSPQRNLRKWAFIVGGTTVALVTTGILVQVLRPTSAFPGDERERGSAAVNAAPAESQSSKSLARVGKTHITYDQVAAECVQRHGKQVLDNLINRTIIANACLAQGIVISQAEVEEEIVNIAKKFNLTTDQWLQMLQAERDIKPMQYRRDIIWPMLALRKLAGAEVVLSEVEMKKAFERNYGKKVKARAIVLDNLRRASEVWEKVSKNPADFGKLARQYSVDPASKPLDGVVPPIRRHGGSPELETAAFKLKEGEYSGIVQVGVNQWVILMCEGYTDQVVKDMSEVRDLLERDLREEKQQELVAQTFENLRKNTRVDNYLEGTVSGVKQPTIQQTSGTIDSNAAPTAAERNATARTPRTIRR